MIRDINEQDEEGAETYLRAVSIPIPPLNPSDEIHLRWNDTFCELSDSSGGHMSFPIAMAPFLADGLLSAKSDAENPPTPQTSS